STRATRGAGPESWGARRKSPDPLRIRASSEVVFGGDLLSHTLTSAVPSALAGLASGFGMGPGVSLPLWPPKLYETRPTRHAGGLLFHILHSGRKQSQLVECVSPRPISTCHLHTLLCFQFRPINPMICGGP